jgi:hypothetical protein
MRTIFIVLTLISGMVTVTHAYSPVNSKAKAPVRIINLSDYDSDIFIDGFMIGTFKATEEANLTMTFQELKIVLNNTDKTTFKIKPADVPEKCDLIVITNKKIDYCPPDKK